MTTGKGTFLHSSVTHNRYPHLLFIDLVVLKNSTSCERGKKTNLTSPHLPNLQSLAFSLRAVLVSKWKANRNRMWGAEPDWWVEQCCCVCEIECVCVCMYVIRLEGAATEHKILLSIHTWVVDIWMTSFVILFLPLFTFAWRWGNGALPCHTDSALGLYKHANLCTWNVKVKAAHLNTYKDGWITKTEWD